MHSMWFAEESSAVMVSLSLPLLKVSTERAEGSCETRKHPPLAAPILCSLCNRNCRGIAIVTFKTTLSTVLKSHSVAPCSFVTGIHYHRPQTKLRKGNVFTSVCQEFCLSGGCIPVCMGGGVCLGGVCAQPPEMATAADGTHPTGMHSC